MVNTTDGWDNLPAYALYSVQGFIICSGNVLIVLSILRHEALRTNKEYLLMLGLSFADSCNMGGFLTAGVYRTYLVLTDQHADLVSPLSCATTLHNILLGTGMPAAHIMLLVVSIDRLICVFRPLAYIGYTKAYSYLVLSVAYSLTISYYMTYVTTGYLAGSDKVLPAPCITFSVMAVAPKWLSAFMQTAPSYLAFSSVLVYMVVWCKHTRQNAVVDGSVPLAKVEKIKRQQKVTATLAMSCVFTFALLCVPMLLGNLILWLGYQGYSLFFYVITTLNPLCNVFLYQVRHKELRTALKKLCTTEPLPIDIRMWNLNQRTQQEAIQMK